MNHFIVEVIYRAPLEKIDEVLPSHREFLQTGFDKGIILMSGPQVPRIGGIIIARANSMEELDKFFSNDPYRLNNIGEYIYTQFNPVKYQEFIKEWI